MKLGDGGAWALATEEVSSGRLRRAIADLTLEKLVLKEAAEGNWYAPNAAGSV